MRDTLISIASRLATENLEVPLSASRVSSRVSQQEREENTQQVMNQDGDDLSSEDESIHRFSDPESVASH